jgi:transposase-like protein
VKVGTIFEDSPIGFAKWLPAMWLIVNCKNGISSCELARDLKVTQKTAWFMLHRIRLAMRNGTIEKLADDVEVDETFIGGLARNMHKQQRERKITGTGGKDKTIVLGVLERGGDVKTHVITERDKDTLESIAADAIIPGSRVYTDAWGGYNDFGDMFRHQVIDHAVEYVNGVVHTNGMENFWSLLKRGLKGTYVSVEPFHLFRYLDEQSFRFNQRRTSDADRFVLALSQIVGRRVMYGELTGKMCRA